MKMIQSYSVKYHTILGRTKKFRKKGSEKDRNKLKKLKIDKFKES